MSLRSDHLRKVVRTTRRTSSRELRGENPRGSNFSFQATNQRGKNGGHSGETTKPASSICTILSRVYSRSKRRATDLAALLSGSENRQTTFFLVPALLRDVIRFAQSESSIENNNKAAFLRLLTFFSLQLTHLFFTFVAFEVLLRPETVWLERFRGDFSITQSEHYR